MPLVLVAALVASLVLHGMLLFLPELHLGDWQKSPEPQLLQARLRPAPVPVPPAAASPPAAQPQPRPAAQPPAPRREPPRPVPVTPAPLAAPVSVPPSPAVPTPAPIRETPPAPPRWTLGPPDELEAGTPREAVAGEVFPPAGELRYQVYRGERGLMVGEARQRWEMGDGRYHLWSVIETTGLAALFRPVRVEMESHGNVGPDGLRPEQFLVRRNGGGGEGADFDWEAGQVRIGDRSPEPLGPGSQDLLSFHYQLAYLPDLEGGAAFPVATGRKYERYEFDALGEEQLELPAGSFRTLHLQSLGSSRTELWLALDQLLLPVKIRHTDKKGEIFEQVLTQMILGPSPAP